MNSQLYRKKLQYQVKWAGFDDDTTWYPASYFKGSPHQLRDFHSEYPSRPGPPQCLNEWMKSWEDGVDDDGNHYGDELPQA